MAGWARDLAAGWDRQEILVTLLVVTSAWAASRIFLLFVDRVASRWTRRTAALQDDYVLAAIRRPVSLLIILVGVYAAIHRYAFRFRWFLDGLIFVAAVGLVIFTLIRVVAVLLAWYGERIRREPGTAQLSRDLLPLADKVARVILLVIGVFVILDHFDIEIRSILVTLGVGSLAIGLALQETLANMFGGFTIMLDRPFRVGDRIQLSSGETGDVQEIGIRSTRVLTLEHNLLVIPNAHLVKTLLTNQSVPDERARVVIEVGIAYDADVARAKALMLETAAADPTALREPPPAAYFREFGDSALRLTLVCHAADFRDALPLRDRLNSGIHARFKEAGIEVAYPTRRVHLG
jgi:small-conductance mechanosensitive channel